MIIIIGVIFGAITYGILSNANSNNNDLKKDSGIFLYHHFYQLCIYI